MTTSPDTINCAFCRKKLPWPKEYDGHIYTCPKCQNLYAVDCVAHDHQVHTDMVEMLTEDRCLPGDKSWNAVEFKTKREFDELFDDKDFMPPGHGEEQILIFAQHKPGITWLDQ